MPKPPWVEWFVDTGERLQTTDGKTVEVWEFKHIDDHEILSRWAAHFRNHYCPDHRIDDLRARKSRKDYLNDVKFPSRFTKLGPPTRAGDFGEILVADYLQWVLNHWVPRMRWSAKPVRDSSPQGCDVIGFQFHDRHATSNDLLTIVEVKACFSRSSSAHRLQDAINGSAKDHIRIDESLNYLRQRLISEGHGNDIGKVDRFQSPVDIPYRELYGAIAVFTTDFFTVDVVASADTAKIPNSKKGTETYPHPNRDRLMLLVIRGNNMMDLVHELYRRAADEA